MAHFFEKVSYLLESENTNQKVGGGLLRGGIYAVKVQPAPLRMLVIRRAVLENLARNIQCIVITPIPAQKFISNLDEESLELFIEGISDGKLKLISPIGDYKKNIFRFGPKRFLDEVEQFSAKGKGFIVLDQAELLFTVDDSEVLKSQVQIYVDWMMRTGNTGLFLLPDSTDFDTGGTYFQPLSSSFSGIASFYTLRSKLEIGVDFWTTQSGMILSKPLPVNTKDDGLIDMQLSLAMDRRNRCRSNKLATPENEPEFDRKESVDDQALSQGSEVDNNSPCIAAVPMEESRPNAVAAYPYPAPVSRPAQHTEMPTVLTDRRWGLWTTRVVMFVTAAVALGTLAVSVEHSDFSLISRGIKPLSDMLAKVHLQNNAIAASNAKPPLPSLSHNVSTEQNLQQSTIMPTLVSATLELSGSIDTKPTEVPELVRAEPKKQELTKKVDRSATVPSQDTLKASADFACPDQLLALSLCGTSSR
jgi:hypothetical protein